MTSGQKIAFSLLAALALFAVFVLSFNSTLFKELETRFYAQSKIEENTGQLDKISESCDSYISEILSLVEKGENAWTKNASVRSYYVQNPSESEVNQRRRLTESLFEQIPALTGIRIVDKNGRNVHYSSFDDTDLLKQNGISKIYKNYNDIVKDAGEIDFEQLQKLISETKSVLLCDESQNRLIISVPFCWVDGIYSGAALFYINLHEVEKELTSRDVISIGQGITLFSDDSYNGGFVLNLPNASKADFRTPFISYWKARSEALSRGSDSAQQPEKLLSLPDGRYYVGLSSNRIGKIRVSAVYTSDVFELSREIHILIYICIFISILLIVFLIFSFFRDPLVTLQKRIKKIQLGIVENYLDGKEKREWSDVARHLRQRRNDLSDEIIKSLHVHSKKRRKEVSEYLEKNWDEIFAIFETKAGAGAGGAGSAAAGGAGAAGTTAGLNDSSLAEIRRMLEEVLQNRNIVVPVAAGVAAAAGGAAGAAVAKKAQKVKTPEPEPVEELVEDAEELDEVEELAEDAEEVDEVEELAEEPEEIEEVEELAEDAEELDEVEELAEDAEELDEVEELVEDAEELDEVEELAEDAEEIEEVEELAEDAEELDEVEELAEDAEELDEVEELEELEEVEELDEVPPKKSDDAFDKFIKTLAVPELCYKPSNDTYFENGDFANVENVFAEELGLGTYREHEFDSDAKAINLTIYPLIPYETSVEAAAAEPAEVEAVEIESVEETIEEPAEAPVEDTVEEPDYIEAPIDDTPFGANDEVEDLSEEVPSYLPEPDFSMTSFADNLSLDQAELHTVLSIPKGPDNAIVESEDGVFSISENLEYTDVVQDAGFKELVDSILQ